MRRGGPIGVAGCGQRGARGGGEFTTEEMEARRWGMRLGGGCKVCRRAHLGSLRSGRDFAHMRVATAAVGQPPPQSQGLSPCS